MKMMWRILKQNYHTKTIEDVLKDFCSNERGLTREEARNRFLNHGPNKLPETKSDSYWRIYLRQFQSPLIYILFFAAITVFFTGEKIDSFVILIVLFFNSLVGTIQEGKAQNIFLALKRFVKTNASVIREGNELIISDEQLVPGDIIFVRAGEKIPSDGRLIRSESLRVDEAALTGESKPKAKSVSNLRDLATPLAEQTNMLFKGTTVVSGTGVAVVTATGVDTVIGNIAQKAVRIDEELPLQNEIRHFSRLIILFVLIISFILFWIGIFYNHAPGDIFSTIVAISVSVIPEGLPVVVTLVLATGVWRMGKRQVLVKRMQAIEALGQTNVIALDKTGTLTKNELTAREIYVDDKLFLVRGSGYEPNGEIELDGKIVEPLYHPELLLFGKIGLLGSNANLIFSRRKREWRISGDPTEAATLVLAEKIGFRANELGKEFKKLDEKPFDNDLQYHATLYSKDSGSILVVIGAPETLLGMSEKIWKQNVEMSIDLAERENLKQIFLDMSSRGRRVVALGMKEDNDCFAKVPPKILSLTFVGFFGLEDSLRTGVREAVKRVESAGIRLVMITGDHEVTAKTVAKEAGIFKEGEKIIIGKQIEEMTEETLADHLDKVSVFARVFPMHKLKIVNAYKLRGKIIAMTGDGINDALSLKASDVGVAMGRIGTEVAKDASDIVLLDDNFGSIVSGVKEGRNILRTIKKVILYLLSTSVGEVLTIIGAILLGMPLPILAAQILWLNLVTDGFLDVALAMEPAKEGFSARKTSSLYGLIDKLMFQRIFVMAVPMAIGTLFLFSRYYQSDLSKAWTISLTTLAVFQWFNAWNCRSHNDSIFYSNPLSNKFLAAATFTVISLQFLAIYNGFFQKLLRTVPLTSREWLIIISVAFSIIAVEEIRKQLYNWKKK